MFLITILLVSYFVPIWYIFIPLLIIGSIIYSTKSTPSFLLGFSSVFLAWFLLMMFMDVQNEGLLSSKIAALFKLPSKWLLIFITALAGALLGGLSTWLGKNLKSSFGLLKDNV
jgi:hypothetical protein